MTESSIVIPTQVDLGLGWFETAGLHGRVGILITQPCPWYFFFSTISCYLLSKKFTNQWLFTHQV